MVQDIFYSATPFLPESGLSGWRGQQGERSVTHGVAEPGAGEMPGCDWSEPGQYSPLVGWHSWPPFVTLARLQSALWTHTRPGGHIPANWWYCNLHLRSSIWIYTRLTRIGTLNDLGFIDVPVTHVLGGDVPVNLSSRRSTSHMNHLHQATAPGRPAPTTDNLAKL